MALASSEGWHFLLRWFHFLAGITWIGMLYYFNFVQTPFFATELGGQARSLMVRGLVPNALWWFRWGAMFTFLTGGLILLTARSGRRAARQRLHDADPDRRAARHLMWANVWFVIWPAQQVVIASANEVAAGGEADPAAARGARAGLASRTNTLFSIPMLFFMGAASHLTLPVPRVGSRSGSWRWQSCWSSRVNALKGTPGQGAAKPLATGERDALGGLHPLVGVLRLVRGDALGRDQVLRRSPSGPGKSGPDLRGPSLSQPSTSSCRRPRFRCHPAAYWRKAPRSSRLPAR